MGQFTTDIGETTIDLLAGLGARTWKLQLSLCESDAQEIEPEMANDAVVSVVAVRGDDEIVRAGIKDRGSKLDRLPI